MNFMCTEMINGLLIGKVYRRASEWKANEYAIMFMGPGNIVIIINGNKRRPIGRVDMTMEWEEVRK